jgi:hypothetical protein
MSNEQDESEMMSSCDGNLPPQATSLSQTPVTPTLNNTTASAASSTANTSTSSLHGGLGGNTTTSANVTQTIPSSVCCGDFIDTLNKPIKNILVTVKFLTHEKLARKTKTMKNNNKEEKNVRGEGDNDEANLSSSSTTSSASSSSSSFGLNDMDDSLSKKLIINTNLNETDVVTYINYCNTWPQRYLFLFSILII